MPYQAGSAISEYTLGIEGLKRNVAEAKRLLLDLKATEQAVLKAPTTGSGGGGGGNRQPTTKQAERDILSLAQAQARLKVASGDTAAAERILSNALSRVDQSSIAAIRTQTQLTRIQNAGTNALQGFASGALQVASGLGVITSAAGLASAAFNKAKEGFVLKGALDEQRQTLGILFGDVQKGNKVFSDAIAFGRKYAFTQEEIGSATQALSQVIRNSTTNTSKQLEVTARLLTLNREEDFAGAGRAISELQAGQANSIISRFNLSRTAANQLKNEIAGGKDAFLALDAVLTKMGVTTATLDQRLLGAAGATRAYKQAQEDLALAFGGFISGPGTSTLNLLTAIIEKATQAQTEVGKTGPGQPQQAQQPSLGDNFSAGADAVTALIKSGVEGQDVLAGLQKAITDVNKTSDQGAVGFLEYASGLNTIANLLAGTFDSAQQRTIATQQQLNAETERNTIAISTREQILAAETAARQAQIAAEEKGLAALQEFNTGLADQAAKATLATAQSELLKQKQADIATASQLAAQGLLGSGDQAIILAQKYGIAIETAVQLINAQQQVSALQDESKANRSIAVNVTRAVNRGRQQIADAQDVAAAQRESIFTTGTQAQKIAVLRDELSKLTPGTAAFIRKQTELNQLLQSSSKSSLSYANQMEKADLALQSNVQQLETLKNKLAGLKDGSLEYKKTLDQIHDLEAKIADEKERQVKSSIDARLNQLDDARKRRDEQKELERARRVLSNGDTSEEQKLRAQEVLQRIPLEQAKRQLEISSQFRASGGAFALPLGGAPAPQAPPLSQIGTPTAIQNLAPALQALAQPPSVEVKVYVDGAEIAARTEVQVINSLRQGLQQQNQAGLGGR